MPETASMMRAFRVGTSRFHHLHNVLMLLPSARSRKQASSQPPRLHELAVPLPLVEQDLELASGEVLEVLEFVDDQGYELLVGNRQWIGQDPFRRSQPRDGLAVWVVGSHMLAKRLN